ncbi:CAMK/CAMK1 protein kinase [Aphanomyces invadans]|uniref:CAMK/CAMK1 protein kinase n=1 Tax=Aphanomyces invadans TaxID=157072 RepID=A0A024UPW0_9STRA|nr:CAMK/CAMK1 protein kinase [Aphanomyces invadans]ETW08441.1 CAMK/CAMK1 protein kinase [Aphanomyces invadans]|eukprot:XP_008862246.1 CAMK/CAMK1 protein kinase [Aphanomyces invadans]
MGEVEAVKIFARLPSYNPFVGTFHHAPSAGNRGAAYFAHDIVGVAELEERKKFRNNPLTGTFHALPGYYDPLHGLKQLRQSEPNLDASAVADSDSMCSSENNQDDANKEFVALDMDDSVEFALVEQTDVAPTSLPLNLSRSFRRRRGQKVTEFPHRSTHDNMHPYESLNSRRKTASTRIRCFSDSDVSFKLPPKVVYPYADARVLALSPTSKRSSTLTADVSMSSMERERSSSSCASDNGRPSHSSSFSSNNNLQDDDNDDGDSMMEEDLDVLSDQEDYHRHHHIYRHYSESDISPSASHEVVDFLTPVVCKKSSSDVCDLVDGYVSTGKGIYRKCGFRTIDTTVGTKPSTLSPTSTGALTVPAFRRHNSGPVDPKLLSQPDDCDTEYEQGAPKVPSNPFIARRLVDDLEENKLRLMSINRSIPRLPQTVMLEKSPKGTKPCPAETYFINPFFIHELAVTEHYELCGEDQLGDGAYAVVKPAIRRSNGAEVAIKQIHKRYLLTDKAKAAVKTEVEIHLRLQHRNIVRLLEVYETESFLYLVMEKARHGTLKQLMQRERRFPEALAAKLAHQIVRGIFFMHELGVVHCDVKPENVLLSDAKDSTDAGHTSNNEVKAWDLTVELCDFGLSVKVPDVRFFKHTGDVHKVPFNGLTGSVGYMAPELFQSLPYGKPVDLWSVGIIIYEMLTGYQPFYPPSICVEEPAEFTPRIWKKFSREAKDLVSHLLERDPTKRFTVEQALTHPWFDSAVFGQ